jgi:4-carboxymuconolactone decarboxylase
MTDPQNALGGRLPLYERANLSIAQRALWDRMEATMGRWADTTGFKSQTGDGRFIGPFNPMLSSPEIASAFLQLQLNEAKFTRLSERVRQVVILSVGSVWQAGYELYAHSAAARRAGFSDSAIAALSSGEASPELNEEESVAQRFTLALTATRHVDDALYEDARRSFGDRGLVDLLLLAGCYQLVCGVLNAFAIPAVNAEKEA